MSAMNLRGGIPIVRRVTTSTTGDKTTAPGSLCYLVARNKDATNVIRLFFRKADFDANVNYVEVPLAAAATPHGEWAGPVELSPNTDFSDVWWKSVAGTPVLELTMFVRHG